MEQKSWMHICGGKGALQISEGYASVNQWKDEVKNIQEQYEGQ